MKSVAIGHGFVLNEATVRVKIYLLVIFFIFLSVGSIVFWLVIWAPNPPIATISHSFDVMIYQGGHIEIIGTLKPGSAGAIAVDTLIKKKSGKWRRSLDSHAPVVKLETHGFSINIQKYAIIYGKHGDLLGPLVSPLAAGEFEDIKDAILKGLEATKGSR